MKRIQKIHKGLGRAAFFIGNGVNLSARIMPSWKELLADLADKTLTIRTEGLSNTEIYNLIEINSTVAGNFKKKVCTRLTLQVAYNLGVHKRLMQFARETNSPVLTTNFDTALSESIGAKLTHLDPRGFSRYYPWKSYYGFEKHKLPTDGFGIWHVHGGIKYPDSIRLGLTDYMGSVEKTRKLLYNGYDSLFRGKRADRWNGHQTWLHIWFNMPIIMFGFGFGVDEIFLRWLLIERKRLCNQRMEPFELYYVTKGDPPSGVTNFLTQLGATIVYVDDFKEIYG